MPSKRLLLTAADSAWLQMETPTNLMTITGVMELKKRLSYERLRAVLEERLLVHERFRLRVVRARGGLGRHRWVEHDLVLEEHLIPVSGADWSKLDLEALVSHEMSTPLDFSKPLWRFLFIGDYPSGSVLVARIHHCIGDGIALMKVLLGLGDPIEGAREPARVGPRTRRATRGLGAQALEVVRFSAKTVASAGYLVAMRRDPKTVFKGRLGTQKVAVWSEDIPLVEVKEIGKRLGGTINDVLLTAAAGALRQYMRDRGQDPAGLDFRAVVPVNLRKPADTKLCNRFGLVYLKLPVGIEGPLERLAELRRRMDRIKTSPEPFVIYGLLKTAGITPTAVQSLIVRFFAKNATAVMTNVPGPPSALAIAGAEIDHLMFWVPQSGRLGMGVSILSYNDQVRVGVATDRNLVDDPDAIVTAFHSALDQLQELASRKAKGATKKAKSH